MLIYYLYIQLITDNEFFRLFSRSSRLSRDEEIELIVSGQVHLIDIEVSNEIEDSDEYTYNGAIGHFCELKWSLHKTEPSKCKKKIYLLEHDYHDIVTKLSSKHILFILTQNNRSNV